MLRASGGHQFPFAPSFGPPAGILFRVAPYVRGGSAWMSDGGAESRTAFATSCDVHGDNHFLCRIVASRLFTSSIPLRAVGPDPCGWIGMRYFGRLGPIRESRSSSGTRI